MALFQVLFHTHVLNKNTHVDHFWCLISKYTEYDNIFISSNFAIKIFNQNSAAKSVICYRNFGKTA